MGKRNKCFSLLLKKNKKMSNPQHLRAGFQVPKNIPILNLGTGHDYYFFENMSLHIPLKSSLKPAILLVKLNFKKLMCEQLNWF